MLQDDKCNRIKKRKSRVRGIRNVMKRGIEVVILNTGAQISFIEKVTFE